MKFYRRQLVCMGSFLCVVFLFFFSGCNPPETQEGGRFEPTPNLEYNPRVISTILIVPPLLVCGKSVTARGFVPGARVRIYADGTLIGEDDGWDSEAQVFAVSPDLVKGQSITATQEFEGVESGPSAAVVVQDHTEVYPAGLPKPTFPHLYLYDCGVATAVGELPPGGSVKVLDGPPASIPAIVIGQADGVAGIHSIGIGPPFQTSRVVVAQSQICSEVSPSSDEQVVRVAPTTLPKPEVTGLYEGGMIVTVHQLVNGTKVTIKRGTTVIAGGGAPGNHVGFRVNTPVSAGDVLEIIQELCNVTSPPGTVVVQTCSTLPPAKILAPRTGDDAIYMEEFVRGSRIRIFSGGQEIGDGGGSVIQLTRPLVANETLIIVQSIGTCNSTTSNVVQVGHGLDDPLKQGACGRVFQYEYGHAGDPSAQTTDISDYFAYGAPWVTISMDSVPLHGLVRYPEGPGPFPLVLVTHGNTGPQNPTYQGLTYLLDQLASHCMIAVSVNEEFLNGFNSGEMDARGIVLLRHLQLWREWNRTPGHRFYGKVQESSIGLVGHSRGGEAVAWAKVFNETLHKSSDPLHNFNFQIRALCAMAPVDNSLNMPPVTLNGADYYILHGSHDGDVENFEGHRFYDRAFPVNGSTNNYKGLLYIYGGNHGQFNSAWTYAGTGELQVGPASALISDTDQRLIARSYITSFLLASLKGWKSYRYFLNGEVTFTSLPASVTRVFQYQDPKRIFINHYEEDNDPATGSQAGVVNSTTGTFTKYVDYKFSDNAAPHFLWEETNGLIAGWQNADNSEIHISIPVELRKKISDYEFLAFRIGQTLEQPVLLNAPGQNKNISVQAFMGSTPGAEVQTNNYQPIPYPMVVTGLLNAGPKSVMQTIRIPLNDMVANPNDIVNISEIVLKFNRHASGIIAMDELQFTD